MIRGLEWRKYTSNPVDLHFGHVLDDYVVLLHFFLSEPVDCLLSQRHCDDVCDFSHGLQLFLKLLKSKKRKEGHNELEKDEKRAKERKR